MLSKWFKNLVIAQSFGKSIFYESEYQALMGINKLFPILLTPPDDKIDPEKEKYIQSKVLELFEQDALNMERGLYSKKVLLPNFKENHLKQFVKISLDSLRISRRRKLNVVNDLSGDVEQPAYLKRNYHFQTDGYFSKLSAEIYHHQVEILFKGTARAMRRMLLGMIKAKFPDKKFIKVLEVGAGNGFSSLDFINELNYDEYVLTDASHFYVQNAQSHISNSRVQFFTCRAEELPFLNDQFDLVISVYLFHEIPRKLRQTILQEWHRVLKVDGVLAISDSIQFNDDEAFNEVIEKFPLNYHEPYYLDYARWDIDVSLNENGFNQIDKSVHLLSKYWIAQKK